MNLPRDTIPEAGRHLRSLRSRRVLSTSQTWPASPICRRTTTMSQRLMRRSLFLEPLEERLNLSFLPLVGGLSLQLSDGAPANFHGQGFQHANFHASFFS